MYNSTREKVFRRIEDLSEEEYLAMTVTAPTFVDRYGSYVLTISEESDDYCLGLTTFVSGKYLLFIHTSYDQTILKIHEMPHTVMIAAFQRREVIDHKIKPILYRRDDGNIYYL